VVEAIESGKYSQLEEVIAKYVEVWEKASIEPFDLKHLDNNETDPLVFEYLLNPVDTSDVCVALRVNTTRGAKRYTIPAAALSEFSPPQFDIIEGEDILQEYGPLDVTSANACWRGLPAIAEDGEAKKMINPQTGQYEWVPGVAVDLPPLPDHEWYIKRGYEGGGKFIIIEPYWTGKYWEEEKTIEDVSVTLTLIEGEIKDLNSQEEKVTIVAGIRDSEGRERMFISFGRDQTKMNGDELINTLHPGDRLNIFIPIDDLPNEQKWIDRFDLDGLVDFYNEMKSDVFMHENEILSTGIVPEDVIICALRIQLTGEKITPLP